MKRFLLFVGLLISLSAVFAQETYTINNETLELKTDIEGELDLLWNIVNNQYRYFVRTATGDIIELKNTRGADNKFSEEYKQTLKELTNNNLDTNKLNLTLVDLRKFLNAYNTNIDNTYVSENFKNKLQTRVAVFGGITNHPFVNNPENIKNTLIGGELEIFEATSMPRHSGYLQLRNTFESDDFKFRTTEISLGYRFRFIKTKPFNIFGNFTFATLSFTDSNLPNETNPLLINNESSTSFDVPLMFGLGADIRIAEGHFITIGFNELFALLIDNQGNFPVDLTIGYRFNL
ncbi:hypothetical protein FJ651_13335 [Paucihalobacter ruber]|uniref:Outer membrane protein beta-barrel domain-containing protein n=1 Tax=Paucihalobacter ruber TaxID=2567861 RepID=A0A506PFE6_9FLAO|nr:hypothetical protein [Paucihalobacter ruber]TPV31802.1 hypothetical protein FJ651_13335 [Paucihalobacter ruber]